MQIQPANTVRKYAPKTALQHIYYTPLSVLRHLIDQRGFDRDTIILVLYNIKTIVSKLWDGKGENDEKWRD